MYGSIVVLTRHFAYLRNAFAIFRCFSSYCIDAGTTFAFS